MLYVLSSLSLSDYSHWYPVDDDNPLGECPAVEVWNYRSPQGTFGMSPRPRLDHPKEVKWRIGQVVRHHDFGYKGVIIGWDLKAKVRITDDNKVTLQQKRNIWRQGRDKNMRGQSSKITVQHKRNNGGKEEIKKT